MKRGTILGVLILCYACSRGAPSTKTPAAPVATSKVAAATSTPAASLPAGSATPSVRLPRRFQPRAAHVRLAIDPARSDFAGETQLEIELAAPQTELLVHAVDLTIGEAVLTDASGKAYRATVTPATHEFAVALGFAEPLPVGKASLRMRYQGKLQPTDTVGAFRQTDHDRPYVYTQFEATSARRVMPIIDEPDIKIPWQLTIDAPSQYQAFANTPEARKHEVATGITRTEFAVSKPLPSYLLAFAIGEFEALPAGKTLGGAPIRIVVPKGRGKEAAYAVQSTARLVHVLETWFGIPYPYAKLDMIAVPVTVGFGAMENPGLITYAERFLLFAQAPSWRQRESWIGIAAHEVAHQWFGNLVTMAWWDDIWLNEGFASWMASKAVREFAPEWHGEDGAGRGRYAAFSADEKRTARRVREPIKHHGDIEQAFDGITYMKGAALLEMWENWLTPEVMQKGVHAYMTAHAHGNATSSDFVAALSQAAGRDVAATMTSYLEQVGAPEVTATLRCDGAPRVALTQARMRGPGAVAEATPQRWRFPICVVFGTGAQAQRQCGEMSEATHELPLEGISTCPAWFYANAGGHGYYGSKLTTDTAEALLGKAWSVLTPDERSALSLDLSRALAAGELSGRIAPMFFEVLLRGEARGLHGLAARMITSASEELDDEAAAKVKQWVRYLIGKRAVTLGWQPRPNDTAVQEATRGTLVALAAWAGEPALVKQAVAWTKANKPVGPAMRMLVWKAAVAHDAGVAKQLLAKLRGSKLGEERRDLLGALAATKDEALHGQLLEHVLGEKLDLREAMMVIGMSDSRAQAVAVERYMRTHFEELLRKLPNESTTGNANRYMYAFTNVCDANRRDEIAAFVREKFAKYPGSHRAIPAALESMDQCIARRATLRKWVGEWLPVKPR